MPTPGGRPRAGLAIASLLVALGLVALGAATLRAPSDPASEVAATESDGAAGDKDDLPVATEEPVLALPAFTVIDTTFNSGLYTSLRLAPDGLPALTHYDDTNGALRYVRCTDAVCADSRSRVVDGDGVTGLSTSLAYGEDGMPVISYYDLDAGAVRVAWCRDPDCRAIHRTLVDAAVQEVTRTALTIAPDGRAEVAYTAGATVELAELHLARCDRDGCSHERIDGPGIGEYVSSARRGDDLVIVYRDETARRLRLASCGADGCAASSPDPDEGAGLQPSVAIAADGTTVVAHLDLAGHELRLLRCTDPTCDVSVTEVLADTAGAGFFPSVALRDDGAPTVAYYDEGTRALWVATCSDAVCDEVERNIVDALGIVGVHLSAILGDDGSPLIAYHDQTNRHLKVVGCANPRCAAPIEAATLGRAVTTFVDRDGRAGVVYRPTRPRDIRVVRCREADCLRTEVIPTDTRSFVGLHGGGAVGSDGSPVVTYADTGRADLRLSTCGSGDCVTLVARDLATSGNVGTFATPSVAGDRLAVAHVDRTRRQLRLVTCALPLCRSPHDVPVADLDGGAGQLDVRHDRGLPVIAHQDPSSGRIHLTICLDEGCDERDSSIVAEGAAPLPVDLEIGADGRPWLLHRDAASGQLVVATCPSLDCRESRTIVISEDGVEASLALAEGRPVVAFLEEGRGVVLSHCPDATCARPQDTVLSTEEGMTTSVTVGPDGRVLVGSLELSTGAPVLLRCPDHTCRDVERIELLTRARG